MKLIAVCICTHNRADILSECLEGLAIQDGLERACVLVVGSNCTDRTPEVVESFLGRIPDLIYLAEKTPGTPVARNRALAETNAKYMAFLDDDAIPQPGWLDGILETFESHGADVVGGKVIPHWKGKRPWWIGDTYYPLLGSVDFGDGMCLPDRFLPTGANMAFRTVLLREVGGFDPKFGICTVNGREVNRYRGDDAYISLQLKKRGCKFLYTGNAPVLHLSRGQTVAFSRELRRARQKGRSMGALGPFEALASEEEDYVWASACALACMLRLHVRDAIVFYIVAVMKKAALREFLLCSGKPRRPWTGSLPAMIRLRRGLLGLLKRTLIGRPVVPELQAAPIRVSAKGGIPTASAGEPAVHSELGENR